MAIRVQHQGGGAGAGVNTESNWKRKYDYQIKQQEKLQDRMFQVGMQNRGAMMQRENMIIGNNLQDNQRRQAREEAQAALKEKREFDAKLRGEERQNQLADIENARAFNMEQQDRQFQMQQEAEENRRRFALQDRSNAMRVDNLNRAMANNEFTPQATAMLQERLDKEMELLTKDPEELEIDATQREEALWKLRNEMRIISIHGRRPFEAPQEQQVPTAQQAFRDPANMKSYTDLAKELLSSGDNPQAITPEALAATATDLYNRFNGIGQPAQQGQPMPGVAGQVQGQPAAQGQPGVQPPPAAQAQAGASGGYSSGVNWSGSPAPGSSSQPAAAPSSPAKAEEFVMPRFDAPVTDYGKVPEVEKMPKSARQSFDKIIKVRDTLLEKSNKYRELGMAASKADTPAGRKKAAQARDAMLAQGQASDKVIDNPENWRMIANLIDIAVNPSEKSAGQAKGAINQLLDMGIDLDDLIKSQPNQGADVAANMGESIRQMGNAPKDWQKATGNMGESIRQIGNAPNNWLKAIEKLRI